MSHPHRPDEPDSSARQARFEGSSAAALPLTPSEDRQWATIAHFGAVLGFVPSLVIYLVYKDRGPFTAQESREALNFTVPPTVAAIVANLLSVIPVIGGVFGVIAVAIWLGLTVWGVVAGIHCNRGQPYRYAFNLRLL